ncbi:AVO2 [Candida theae]|uniref:AVO2 n=1 Tax=Candida theae TaxID=1198502 RepID=A0AAD5FXC3_9ASCO|nr:AVO2 [Candida theae]KAI5952105.1 AVO2 [Candida theae]
MLDPSTRLRNAVIAGNLAIVKRILSRFPELWLNVDPNHQGWSNLHYASYHGHYLICFHLITFINKTLGNLQNEYTTLDLLTFDNLNVLHLTMEHHHSQTLHYLLQEFPGKIWLNSIGGPHKQSPLHYSCRYNFKEGTNLLLEFGANYNLADENGDTCLHICFQYGSIKCLYEISNHIIRSSKDKDTAKAAIDTFENVKNKNGWIAKDFASSFELIQQYEDVKSRSLASYDLVTPPPPEPLAPPVKTQLWLDSERANNFSRGSLEENKVLTSPIVSMSQQQQQQQQHNSPSLSRPPYRRQHSQSVPNEQSKTTSNETNSNPLRQRSNTTFSSKPTPLNISSKPSHTSLHGNSMGSLHGAVAPLTPLNPPKTPSIKSVTISPVGADPTSSSIDKERDLESPQSVSSGSSYFAHSSDHHYSANTRTRKPSVSKPTTLPSINSPVANTFDEASGQQSVTANTQLQSHELKPSPASSSSSIAAKVAFNSSRSSSLHNVSDTSPMKTRPRSSSRQPSNLSNSRVNSFNSTSSSNSAAYSIPQESSIANSSSSSSSFETIHRPKNNSENDVTTSAGTSKTNLNHFTLKKSRSSGTLPSKVPKNGGHHVFVHTAGNTSLHSLNSNADYETKSSVNSISFSRVR